MRRASLALMGWLLVACSTDGWRPGTGVGNPGSTTAQLSRVAGVVSESAEATVKELVAERCEGERLRTEVNRVVDLLSPEPLQLTGGELCAVELHLQSPIVFRGRPENHEGRFDYDIPLPTVRLVPVDTLVVDGQALVLELGNGTWIDLESPTDSVAEIAQSIAEGSALWVDTDEDGEIDESERHDGPLAEHDDDDSGDDQADDTGNEGEG